MNANFGIMDGGEICDGTKTENETDECATSGRNAMIFYRLMPSEDFSYENIMLQDDYKVLHVKRVQDCSPKLLTPPRFLEYKCEGVFYLQPQRYVYNTVMKDVLARVIEGCDATILAYGQTGSGKTTSISGLKKRFHEAGFIPHFFGEMFDLQSKMMLEKRITYKMSYVELIEPDVVRDLLVTVGEKKTAELIYRDRLKTVSRLVLPCESDAFRLLFQGEARRSVENTPTYTGGSCSHTVLTIDTESMSSERLEPEIACGRIHFVDMMGINGLSNQRRHLSPQVQGQANLAKMLFEQLIGRLKQSDEPVTQLRNWTSIVLDYLEGSLNRRAIMRIIGHLHGSPQDLEVTHSTLRLGSLIGTLQTLNLVKCVKLDPVLQKIKEEEETTNLIQHLTISRAYNKEKILNNGEALLSVARVEHLQRLVPEFLFGNVPMSLIVAMQQTPLFVELCKEYIEQMVKVKREDIILLEALRAEEAAMLEASSLSLVSVDSSSEVVVEIKKSSSQRRLSSKSADAARFTSTASKESAQKKKVRSIEKMKRNSIPEKEDGPPNITTDAGVSKDMHQVSSSHIPVRAMPSKALAWESYVVTVDAMDLQQDIFRAEALDRQSNEVYEMLKADVMMATQELEEIRKELYLMQKLRRSKNESSARENIVIGDRETVLGSLCVEKEADLNNRVDEMHRQKLIRSATGKNLLHAREKFEHSYQEFCLSNYGTPNPGSNHNLDDDDASTRSKKNIEYIYNDLQRTNLLCSKSHSTRERKKTDTPFSRRASMTSIEF